MRKLFQIMFMLCMVIFTAQPAFAGSSQQPQQQQEQQTETITDGADLSAIRIIAVGYPRYTPVAATDPSYSHLIQIIHKAGKVSKCQVLSFDEVADCIRKDKRLNIKTIDEKKAMEEFKKYVDDYADAYLIVWVANNSRTSFFFDVYKSGTNELLYTCEVIASKYAKDSEYTFTDLTEQFYKKFDNAAEKQRKEREKAAKKAASKH